MEINNIFNCKRFGKYLVSDLTRCGANFGVSFITITLAGVLAYLIAGAVSMATGSGWYSSNALIRTIYIGISAVILICTMPAKCYGFITDKRAGANWLMLPVSTTEKFISMLLNTMIIIPSAFLGGVLLLDWLIVALDPNLDTTIIGGMKELFWLISEMAAQESEVNAFLTENIANGKIFLTSIDDIATWILMFLLGALYFKKNKATKTVLTWIAVCIIISIFASPFMLSMSGNINMETINAVNNGDLEASYMIVDELINKAIVFDVILDTILMVGAAVGIFFRIKTLKH